MLKISPDTADRAGLTVGAKDVGEDSPEVLIFSQLIDNVCQATRGHFEKERKMFGKASIDQELGQGDRAEL